jgi:hypothetical protein
VGIRATESKEETKSVWLDQARGELSLEPGPSRSSIMFNWIWTRVQIVGLVRDPSEASRGDGESEPAADTPDSAPKFSFPLAVLK